MWNPNDSFINFIYSPHRYWATPVEIIFQLLLMQRSARSLLWKKCYSLRLECPPNPMCSLLGPPHVAVLRDGGTSWGEIQWKEVRSSGYSLGQNSRTAAPSPLFLLLGCHKGNGCPVLPIPIRMDCATLGPKQEGRGTISWSLWNHEPKENASLIKQGFYHSDTKRTNRRLLFIRGSKWVKTKLERSM